MHVMSKETLYANQTFINKVVECTGDIENAFAMSILNGLSLTDEILIGTELIKSEVTNKTVVSYFTEDNRPATGTKYLDPDFINPYEFPLGEFPFSF